MYCSRPEERWSEYLRFMGERPAADEKNQKYVNRVNTYKSFLLFKSFVGFVDLAVLDGCSLDSLELGALEEASIDMTLSLVTALSERLASLEEATEGSLRRLVEVVSFLLEMIKKKNIDTEVGTQTCSLLFNCHNLLLDKMRRCFLSDPASIPGLHEPVLKLLTAFIDSQTSNSVTDHRAFLSSVLGLVQATVAGDSSSLQEVKKKFLVVLCLIPLNYPQIEVAVFLQTVKSLAENLGLGNLEPEEHTNLSSVLMDFSSLVESKKGREEILELLFWVCTTEEPRTNSQLLHAVAYMSEKSPDPKTEALIEERAVFLVGRLSGEVESRFAEAVESSSSLPQRCRELVRQQLQRKRSAD